MKITELRCTSCNGTLKMDENNPRFAVCEYCQTRFFVEQDSQDDITLRLAPGQDAYSDSHISNSSQIERTPARTRVVIYSTFALFLITTILWFGSRFLTTFIRNEQPSNQPLVTAQSENNITHMDDISEPLIPFTGIFAQVAENALGLPADSITEADLARFKWLECKYSMEEIQIGYSFDNPYETEDAVLTWIHFPRENAREDWKQLARFKSLKRLSVPSYLSAEILNAMSLESLECYSKTPENLAEMMAHPEQLRELSLKSGIESLVGISKFTGLESLTLNGSSLTDIRELANVKWIKSLKLINCDDISDFSVFYVMPWLQKLSIEAEQLKDIGFISSMPELKSFSLYDAKLLNLNELAGNPVLASLSIEGCDSLMNADGISGLTSLTQLSLEIPYRCPEPDLSRLNQITSLSLTGFKDINFIKKMEKLVDLQLSSCQINSSSVFSGLKNLKSLTCSRLYGELSDWNFAANIPSLEQLDLRGISTYEDISNLFNIPSLKELYLNGAECEINFSKLKPNESLAILEIDGMKLYKNAQISGGDGITFVDYDTVTLDEHTGFLTNYPMLKKLSLSDNTLTQISFASSLSALEYLDISENYVTDLRPLEGLSGLKTLNCRDNPIENYRVLNDSVLIIK